MSLNEVCDWLHLKSGVLARFGVTPHQRTVSPKPTSCTTRSLPKSGSGRCSATSSTPFRIPPHGARVRADCDASRSGSIRWIQPSSSRLPTAWTGPNTADARRPPRCTRGSTCTASFHHSQSWTPRASTTTSAPARSARRKVRGSSCLDCCPDVNILSLSSL